MKPFRMSIAASLGIIAIAAVGLMGMREGKPLWASVAFPDDPPRPGDGEPRPIYATDASDSWNRIFNALFTRAVRYRLSEDLAGDAPLERVKAMGFNDLRATKAVSERVEVGDMAIEPLDPFPVHMGSNGSPQRVLDEPCFSQLKQALSDLREAPNRPPLARALMQSDLWAAHDILVATGPHDEVRRGRKEELLGLLARSVKKLALSTREIEALPDNFAEARLPFDLFAADSGWIEVEYLPERLHEFSSDDRRVARVFLKPASPPRDRGAWLDKLRDDAARRIENLDAVALVVQLLLVDADGVVVPSRLTFEVQVRTFAKSGPGRLAETKIAVSELSRKAMLLDRRPGGLLAFGESEPSYLPRSGNDYAFATPALDGSGRVETVRAPLRMRCQACHGDNLGVIFTFSVHAPEPPRRVRALETADNEHGRYVARQKMLRPDFKELIRRWGR